MEYLFEFILSLVLEIGIDATHNNKITKPLRIILFIFIVLFFVAVIGAMYFFAFYILDKSILGAVFIFVIATVLFVCSIVKFAKTYIRKKGSKTEK